MAIVQLICHRCANAVPAMQFDSAVKRNRCDPNVGVETCCRLVRAGRTEVILQYCTVRAGWPVVMYGHA